VPLPLIIAPAGPRFRNRSRTQAEQGTVLANAAFGAASYLLPANLLGAVLRCTATTGACVTMQTANLPLVIEGLAIVGPGTGTSTGLLTGSNANPTDGLFLQRTTIANFSTGWQATNLQNSEARNLRIRGAHTCLLMPTALGSQSTVDYFFNANLESCDTVGADVGTAGAGASSIHFDGGLVAMGGTTGSGTAIGIRCTDCDVSSVRHMYFQNFLPAGTSGGYDIDFEGTFASSNNTIAENRGSSNDNSHNGILLNGCVGCNVRGNRWLAGRFTIGPNAYNVDVDANGFSAITVANNSSFPATVRFIRPEGPDVAPYNVTMNAGVTAYKGATLANDGLPYQVAAVNALGLSTAVAPTTLFTPATAGISAYRIQAYLAVSNALCTGGTITLTITYNDGATAKTLTATTASCGLGSAALIPSTFISQQTGVPIQYSTTFTGVTGSPLYEVIIALERLEQ